MAWLGAMAGILGQVASAIGSAAGGAASAIGGGLSSAAGALGTAAKTAGGKIVSSPIAQAVGNIEMPDVGGGIKQLGQGMSEGGGPLGGVSDLISLISSGFTGGEGMASPSVPSKTAAPKKPTTPSPEGVRGAMSRMEEFMLGPREGAEAAAEIAEDPSKPQFWKDVGRYLSGATKRLGESGVRRDKYARATVGPGVPIYQGSYGPISSPSTEKIQEMLLTRILGR